MPKVGLNTRNVYGILKAELFRRAYGTDLARVNSLREHKYSYLLSYLLIVGVNCDNC